MYSYRLETTDKITIYSKLLCGYMSFGRLAGTALEFVL